MKKIIIVFFAYSFFSSSLLSIIVGSNSTVGRLGPIHFPSSDANNTALGFYSFDGGFSLQDELTTCTIDLTSPVGAPVTFNGGSLFFKSDLILGSESEIVSFGNIIGNNKTLSLAPTITEINFTNTSNLFGLLGTSSFGSTPQAVDWNFTGSYVVVATSAFAAGAEVYILRVTSTTVTLTNRVEVGNNVLAARWSPFSQRLITGGTGGTGTLRSYLYTPATNTLSLVQALTIPGNKNVNALSFHPTGSWVAVGFDTTANATGVAVYDFNSPAGFFSFEDNAIYTTTRDTTEVCWDNIGRYVAVGTANSNNSEGEVLVYYFDGCCLTLTYSIDTGVGVNSISWNPTGSYIAVGFGGNAETFRLYEHVVQNGVIVERLTGRQGLTGTVNALHWHPNGDMLILSENNPTTPTVFRTYRFYSSTKSFSKVEEFKLTSNMQSARWNRQTTSFALCDTSTVYIMTSAPNNPAGLTSTTFTYTLNNLRLECFSNLTVNIPIRFEGNCKIDGRGCILNIANVSQWTVAQSSTLELENLLIEGVSGTKFFCFDSTASIICRNVIFSLSGSYSFTSGNLLLSSDLLIQGPYSFTYQSAGLLTVTSGATLLLDTGTTFRYQPPTTQRDRIVFQDQRATLYLKQCTLSSSVTGLQLTKGSIVVDGNVSVQSDAVNSAQAITFGTGAAQNDVNLFFMPGARLTVRSGFLLSRNTN